MRRKKNTYVIFESNFCSRIKKCKKKSFEKSLDYLIAEKALILLNEYNSFENSAILSFLLLRVNFTLIKAGRKMQKTQFLKSTFIKYKKKSATYQKNRV